MLESALMNDIHISRKSKMAAEKLEKIGSRPTYNIATHGYINKIPTATPMLLDAGNTLGGNQY